MIRPFKPAPRTPWLLLTGIILNGVLGACASVISVPPDAPVMLSADTSTANPFVRQHGQWIATKGNVTLHAGEVVVSLSATRPEP